MRVTKRIREEYEALLKDVGEAKFFSHVVVTGVLARTHFEYPENMMLDQAEAFFILYRTTGNRSYFTIGRLLRRAAHKIYRDSKRKNPDYPVNKRFLDSVG
jgi:hypothetical protein